MFLTFPTKFLCVVFNARIPTLTAGKFTGHCFPFSTTVIILWSLVGDFLLGWVGQVLSCFIFMGLFSLKNFSQFINIFLEYLVLLVVSLKFSGVLCLSGFLCQSKTIQSDQSLCHPFYLSPHSVV